MPRYGWKEETWGDNLIIFGVIDMVFLAIFTFELLARIKVMTLKVVLKTPVFAMDFFIVLAGWVADMIVPLVMGNFFARFEPVDPNAPQDKESAAEVITVLKSLRAVGFLSYYEFFPYYVVRWSNHCRGGRKILVDVQIRL